MIDTESANTKDAGTKNTCIGGTYIREIYTRNICFGNIYIKNILACASNAYIRYTYSKSVNTKNVYINASYIGNTSVWDNDFKGIDDKSTSAKSAYTRDVYIVEGIYMYTRSACIVGLYTRDA